MPTRIDQIPAVLAPACPATWPGGFTATTFQPQRVGFTGLDIDFTDHGHERETMGIFDWLKTPKTNVDLLDDVIWLTKQAKYGGSRRRPLVALPNQPDRLPCCWWPTSETAWSNFNPSSNKAALTHNP